MAKIPYQNPGSTEVQSPLISGITDGLNKISGMINMETQTDTVNLQEVYVDATDRYRIYEAPQGQKNWLRSPEPIIRKNGNIINPTINFYTIDYVGGSITFAEDARQTSTDEFSAEVTFIVESDLKMPLKADLDPDTKKLISSQIPDTLATKEELKPLQDKLEMDKGYFTDAEQLKRTYPVGEVGWHAVVGTTDTVWIWDGDTGAWVNSGTSDINASKVPFTKTTEVDSTNVQDAIEKLGINKANKDLTNVENTTFKNKGNSAGLAYKDLTNITDLTFKQKGDAAGLATKDLSNVDNTIFKAKGNSAGLAYADLVNINNATFKSKGYTSGLETDCLCNCTKTSSVFNISPVHAIYSDQKFKLLYFKAPADYVTGDTFNIAGVPVSFIVNSISSKSEIPNKVFKQYQVVSVLYDIASTNIYLVNPNSPFTDLSNVELRDFYNVGINSGLSIAPGVDYSFNSTTNTYTLIFDTALGYKLFDNTRTQLVPVTFYNTNPITNSTKFKAPDRNGSSIEYVFFIGHQPATSWSSFSLILGSTSLVLDIINKRIYLPISSLFNMDYSQVAYGMQLPVGLRLKNTGNYGSRLRFGDGDYCYLGELADDTLTMHATKLKLEAAGGSTDAVTISTSGNGNINLNVSGTGKTLYNNTEVAKVDLSNITSTQLDLKLLNASNFINHKCNATKSGTVFTLTVSPATVIITNVFSASFIATANFNAGDTFTIQFSSGSYSDLVPYVNGKIATKGFLLNDVVTLNVNLNSKKVFFRSSAGGLELPADYINGGIILPDKPEEIKKVTKLVIKSIPPLIKNPPILPSMYVPVYNMIMSKHEDETNIWVAEYIGDTIYVKYHNSTSLKKIADVRTEKSNSQIVYPSMDTNSVYTVLTYSSEILVFDTKYKTFLSWTSFPEPIYNVSINPSKSSSFYIFTNKNIYLFTVNAEGPPTYTSILTKPQTINSNFILDDVARILYINCNSVNGSYWDIYFCDNSSLIEIYNAGPINIRGAYNNIFYMSNNVKTFTEYYLLHNNYAQLGTYALDIPGSNSNGNYKIVNCNNDTIIAVFGASGLTLCSRSSSAGYARWNTDVHINNTSYPNNINAICTKWNSTLLSCSNKNITSYHLPSMFNNYALY